MNPTSCFAIAYVLSGPTDGSRWTVWVPSIVLPIIGIVIVLFCLGSFIFPYGEKFKSTNQVFKGYGLDLEISLLTVFVLLGVALSLTKVGIFLYTSARDVSTLAADNNRLLVELKNAKDAADRAGRFVVYTSMKLPTGVNLNAVDITKLQCHYLLASSGNWVNQDVTRGVGLRDLSCPIVDISRGDVVQVLQVWERGTQKVIAEAENIYPLTPRLELHLPTE